jgi:hypothetical protein
MEQLDSMDVDSSLPPVPAYYNLGFIALNQAALRLFEKTFWQFRIVCAQ